MRISFSQTPRWLLTLLMLMYVGQSVASISVPCHLLSQEVEEHQHHLHEMDHSAHAGAGLPAIEGSSDIDREQGSLLHIAQTISAQTASANTALHDCCDAMNHCTSGNCSMSSLDENEQHTFLNAGGNALAAAADKSPARLASSPYRPPILL